LGEPPAGGVLTGWRFAAAAAAVFAAPLVLALAGAVWFRDSRDCQLAAGLAGLGLGITLVAGAGRLLYGKREVLP
jgi:hypothetical protein